MDYPTSEHSLVPNLHNNIQLFNTLYVLYNNSDPSVKTLNELRKYKGTPNGQEKGKYLILT